MFINRIKVALFSIGLVLVFGLGAYGQTPKATPTPQDPVLAACEQTADLARRLQIENDGLKVQLTLEQERTANAKAATQNAVEQAAFWQKATQSGDKMDNNSQLIIFELRQQVANDQIQIHNLEDENKSLRSSRNWRTGLGFAAGFGTGYYLKSRQ